jgi:DNA-binding PadR family transcriptional regulator
VKTYTLTPQGRQQLKAEMTRWHLFSNAITRVLDAPRPRTA